MTSLLIGYFPRPSWKLRLIGSLVLIRQVLVRNLARHLHPRFDRHLGPQRLLLGRWLRRPPQLQHPDLARLPHLPFRHPLAAPRPLQGLIQHFLQLLRLELQLPDLQLLGLPRSCSRVLQPQLEPPELAARSKIGRVVLTRLVAQPFQAMEQQIWVFPQVSALV